MTDEEQGLNEELSEDEAKALLKIRKTAGKAESRLRERRKKKNSKLKHSRDKTDSKLTEHRSSVKQAEKVSAKEAMRKAQMKSHQVKTAEKRRKKAKTTKDIAEKAARKAAEIIASSKWGILIVVLFLVVFGMISTLATSCCASLADGGTRQIASTFTADDSDLIAANDHLNNRENGLRDYINHIPDYYIGWNEYNYYIGNIGHDPYQLVSYLSAMKMDFDYNWEIEDMVNKVYEAMYHVETESIHEVRSYTHTKTDFDGNDIEETVEYDYYILNVRLTPKSVEEVVIDELRREGVYEIYLEMRQNQGNKPGLF